MSCQRAAKCSETLFYKGKSFNTNYQRAQIFIDDNMPESPIYKLLVSAGDFSFTDDNGLFYALKPMRKGKTSISLMGYGKIEVVIE